MAAITDYASLTSAIPDWAERTYTSDQTDQFIALAEAEFRLYFGPHFIREDSVTLGVVAGSADQPTGFVRILSMTHDTYGALNETTMQSVRTARLNASGIPSEYAVTGTTIEFGPSFDGSVTMDFEGTLMGLSGTNTTNWLISNAPQAYLAMCLSMAAARDEAFDKASAYSSSAKQVLMDLGIQSIVAQLGRATVRISGPTP